MRFSGSLSKPKPGRCHLFLLLLLSVPCPQLCQENRTQLQAPALLFLPFGALGDQGLRLGILSVRQVWTLRNPAFCRQWCICLCAKVEWVLSTGGEVQDGRGTELDRPSRCTEGETQSPGKDATVSQVPTAQRPWSSWN